MKKLSIMLLAGLFVLGGLLPARGQNRDKNWHFGDRAVVQFTPTGPVALYNSAMTSLEGCATLSDEAGQLLAYTNGEIIWDRQHLPMPNGSAGLGGSESTSQAALLLPLPGNPNQVYLFCADATENNLVGGLRYSVVNFNLRGGLGDVTAIRGVRLPTPTTSDRVTEKLTAARHANGHDYWIIVHGWQSDAFYSFLLSAAGLSTTPVVSHSGSVHQGGGNPAGLGNSVGCMKVSPDGTYLASAQRDNLTELFSFDNATGQVSNAMPLRTALLNYGVEFSPNSSRLYVSNIYLGITQYDLTAGSPAAILNSAILVATANQRITPRFGALQLGPDGLLYIAAVDNGVLDVITDPNALGTACQYKPAALALAGRRVLNGLPNFPNVFAPPPPPTLALTAVPSCPGTSTTFTGTTTSALPGGTATWNFGDPTSGTANAATGFTASHVYALAGTYQVTLTVTHPTLTTPLSSTQAVLIAPLAPPRLPADTLVCALPVRLQALGMPAGRTYRWQDGSTASSYLALIPGLYTVQVTSPTGCVATASTQVRLGQAPVVTLGADTAVCPSAEWVVRTNPQPAGTLYRWQDGSTAPTYLAHGPGTYTVAVRMGPTGCLAMASRQATGVNCLVLIPNIITPNQDGRNDAFVLQGLRPADWQLRVFDRWGRLVFEQARYDNNWQAAGLSSGLYYYRLTSATTAAPHQGWVEVVQR